MKILNEQLPVRYPIERYKSVIVAEINSTIAISDIYNVTHFIAFSILSNVPHLIDDELSFNDL